MTEGQQLIEQGRQLGFLQGIQVILLHLLVRRFGDAVNTQVLERITTASLEQLATWSYRVVSAATLAEVLAD